VSAQRYLYTLSNIPTHPHQPFVGDLLGFICTDLYIFKTFLPLSSHPLFPHRKHTHPLLTHLSPLGALPDSAGRISQDQRVINTLSPTHKSGNLELSNHFTFMSCHRKLFSAHSFNIRRAQLSYEQIQSPCE